MSKNDVNSRRSLNKVIYNREFVLASLPFCRAKQYPNKSGLYLRASDTWTTRSNITVSLRSPGSNKKYFLRAASRVDKVSNEYCMVCVIERCFTFCSNVIKPCTTASYYTLDASALVPSTLNFVSSVPPTVCKTRRNV